MKTVKISKKELKELRNLYDIQRCRSPARMLTSLQTTETIAYSWNMITAKICNDNGMDVKKCNINLRDGVIEQK